MREKRQFHSLSALSLGQEQTGWGPQGRFIHSLDGKKKTIHAIVGNWIKFIVWEAVQVPTYII